MKVAWHEVPGMHAPMIPSRRVRYDRAALRDYGLGSWTKRGATDHTVPYGMDRVRPLPGTSCQATFIQSLRDKDYFP
jgi:hypothetical protein